jgi:hypothetical protein
MASWKIQHIPGEKEVEYIPFSEATKFFAVDASGSTGGAPLRSEQTFVEKVHAAGNQSGSWITKWGSTCDDPIEDWTKFKWRSDKMGTNPSEILHNEGALGCILSSDLWVL